MMGLYSQRVDKFSNNINSIKFIFFAFLLLFIFGFYCFLWFSFFCVSFYFFLLFLVLFWFVGCRYSNFLFYLVWF